MSRFEGITEAPVDEIFLANESYKNDSFEKKVDLSIGVYRTDKGQAWVLPVVQKAEKMLAYDETSNKEYLPSLGLKALRNAGTKLILGDGSPAILENRVVAVQSLSATGGLCVGADFLRRVLGYKVFYCSIPAYDDHIVAFFHVGFEEYRSYRYWNAETRWLDIDGMLEDLRNAPENAVIILHAVAHNPTGCDPTKDQWKSIASVIKEKNLFPVFDGDFLGMASGDLEKDAWAVRYFVSQGLELVVAQSFSKNMGLYSDRVGNLVFVLSSALYENQIKSQLELIVTGMYYSPPNHGARIVSIILNNKQLREEWNDNLFTMVSHIKKMRQVLRSAIERIDTPGDWSHITSQVGMFSYTGLNEQQCLHMINTHHIYMLRSGRINICGITLENVDYVAECIYETIVNVN